MKKRRMTTLFLIVLADMSGAAAIIPIIPVYVLGQFHANALQAALVIPAYYVAQVLAAPWLGNLSDRVGRRPVLLLSQAGTILAYLLLVLAAPLGALLNHTGLQLGMASGLVVVYLARILDGVTGGNISVAQAYASDISVPEERTHALGLVGGASGLGHILGPALAGLLAGFGLLSPFVGAAGVSVVTLLLTFRWLDEPARRTHGAAAQPAKAPLTQVLRNRPVARILAMALVIGLYMAALFGTFALYADRVLLPGQPSVVVVRAVGLIITVLGVVMALTQIVLLRPLVGHLGERTAVLLGSALLLASAVGFFAVTSLWAIIAFAVTFAFGYGIVWPTLQSLVTSYGAKESAGNLLGWFQSAFSLALIVGPIWGGYVFDAVAPQAVFAVSAGLMLLALLVGFGLQRLPKTAQAAMEPAGSNEGGWKAALRSFHH